MLVCEVSCWSTLMCIHFHIHTFTQIHIQWAHRAFNSVFHTGDFLKISAFPCLRTAVFMASADRPTRFLPRDGKENDQKYKGIVSHVFSSNVSRYRATLQSHHALSISLNTMDGFQKGKSIKRRQDVVCGAAASAWWDSVISPTESWGYFYSSPNSQDNLYLPLFLPPVHCHCKKKNGATKERLREEFCFKSNVLYDCFS